MASRPPTHRPFGAVSRDERRRNYDLLRSKEHGKTYDHQWRKVRDLVRAKQPLCEQCLREGVTKAGEEVDHIIPVYVAPDKRLEMDNLQHICRAHHAIKGAADRKRWPTNTI